MNSGKLRHRIIIQTYTDVLNAYGETTKSWTTFATRWASIKSISGREYIQSDKVQGDVSYTIKIRQTDGMLNKMRVLYGTIVYEIEAVLPDPTSNKHQILMCRKKDG